MNRKFAEDGFLSVKAPDLAPLIDDAVASLARALSVALPGGAEAPISADFESPWSGIEAGFEKLFQTHPATYFGLLRAWARSAEVLALCTSSPVVSAVLDCGVSSPSVVTEPTLHVVSPNLVQTQDKVFTPFHQDYYSTRGSIGQCVVWIPLHDVRENHATVEVLPGSHLLGPLPTIETEFGSATTGEITESLGCQLRLKTGDFLVFSSMLVHRTTAPTIESTALPEGSEGPVNQRWAISIRFNDLDDAGWRDSNYTNPFGRCRDSELANSLMRPTVQHVQQYFNTGN